MVITFVSHVPEIPFCPCDPFSPWEPLSPRDPFSPLLNKAFIIIMNIYGYVYGVRLQTKVRVNQDTFCMIMN